VSARLSGDDPSRGRRDGGNGGDVERAAAAAAAGGDADVDVVDAETAAPSSCKSNYCTSSSAAVDHYLARSHRS